MFCCCYVLLLLLLLFFVVVVVVVFCMRQFSQSGKLLINIVLVYIFVGFHPTCKEVGVTIE